MRKEAIESVCMKREKKVKGAKEICENPDIWLSILSNIILCDI